MFKRPAPKKFSAEELQNITQASAQQTGSMKVQRSYDPDYPVFEVPVNSKVLAYVPNHTVTSPDGIVSLRMDKFAAHSCQSGRSFQKVRCTQGIVAPSLGLDGSCPFCEALPEVWDLVHKDYSALVRSKGGNPDDENSRETYKNDYYAAKKNMAISQPSVYVTFPIVVIECEVRNGKATTTPKKNPDGTITGTVMWYSCMYKTYEEKWLKALETAPETEDGQPLSPAGLWVALDYTYTSEDGKYTKMDSARKLTVGYKAMNADYNAWAQAFDNQTASWTPEKAMEVVVDNVLRDMPEQQELADSLMKSTRDKLAMYDLGAATQIQTPVGGVLDSAAESLAAFGATEVAPQIAPPQGAPQAIPQQIPQGVPQQIPQGVPQQIPQGVPQGVPTQQTMPTGVPQQGVQMPTGVPQQGIPQQIPTGVPQQGIPQQGFPTGFPNGMTGIST